jgi:hypothetical protein
MAQDGRTMAVDWPLISGYGRTMKPPTRPIKDIAEAFTTGGRTSLYAWLYEHIDELPAYRRRNVDWGKVTRTLSALGLKGRNPDKPLNENLVRKTYHRVLADREATGRTSPAAQQPTPPPSGTADRPRHQFKVARLKRPEGEE